MCVCGDLLTQVDREFGSADTNGSKGVDFGEFTAYYERVSLAALLRSHWRSPAHGGSMIDCHSAHVAVWMMSSGRV